MQAVILAAGNSSRFYPYNQDIEHKSLITMMGKTLLEHTIDALQQSGITDVVIIVKKNSHIADILPKKKDLTITFVEQPEALGMGHALLQAKKHLKNRFFVLGGYHFDIKDFVQELLAHQKSDEAVILAKKDIILDRYGNVEIKGNKVLKIVEKPEKVGKEGFRLLALYLLPKKFVTLLKTNSHDEYYFEKALNIYAKNDKVRAVVTEKPSITLKYAWDLLQVKDYLLSTIHNSSIAKNAHIAKDVVISGHVVIEEHATILEGACIKGPAYIGKGATIGNRAILRNGVIVEHNSIVGSQMEVKNTFIMDNTTTHAGFIGDSLIGAYTKIAAGFLTANARLDRQPITSIVKDKKVNTGLRHFGAIIGNRDNIGIRVSTMPGVIVGNTVIIGPSTTIMRNIEDNKKYFTKFQEIIEENNEK